MKVLLFARSYEDMAGGIEKMTLLIARGLIARGHKVVIASIDSSEAKSFYDWPEEVLWEKISLGDSSIKASITIRFLRAMSLRRITKKHKIDTAIGFQVGSFALIRFSSLGLGLRLIAAERNAPTLFKFIRNGQIKKFFSNLILFTASGIAVQFPSYRLYYPLFLRSKIVCTPNPVASQLQIRKSSRVDAREIKLLFVGRLTYQKNLQVLIRAIKHTSLTISLTAIGAGPDLNECKKLALDLGVSVDFLPPTHELTEFYLNSDFLVLPSRWEGFPNVAAEALSFGLPVIGFSSCSGVTELISTGVNGFLCRGEMNEFTLAAGILEAKNLLWDPEIIADSISLYTFDNFIDCWERVL